MGILLGVVHGGFGRTSFVLVATSTEAASGKSEDGGRREEQGQADAGVHVVQAEQEQDRCLSTQGSPFETRATSR